MLSGAEHKVLAALRRKIPDGERRKLSNEEIWKESGVGSEGTVSVAVRRLADLGYIQRHFLGRGRGRGYEIEVVSPREQQLKTHFGTPEKGSLTDPLGRSFLSGDPTPQTPPKKGSLTDPSIFYIHDHEQQQQLGADSEIPVRTPELTGQLAPETVAALEQAGAHVKLIQRVARANPTCTPGDVAAALAAASAKPNAHTPPGLALECLASNQPVIRPRAVATRTESQPGERKKASATNGFDVAQARAFVERQQETEPDDALPVVPSCPPIPLTAVSPDLGPYWQSALNILRSQISPGEFDAWFRLTRLIEFADGEATVSAPDHARAVLSERFVRLIGRALGETMGGLVRVRIITTAT